MSRRQYRAPVQALFLGLVVVALLALVRVGTLAVGAAVVATLVLVAANVTASRQIAARQARAALTPRRAAPPLALCWLVLSLTPIHNFVLRSNSEAVSELGIEPVLELAYFLAIGAYAIVLIGRFEPSLRVARPPLLLLLLPIWVIASSTWSDTGPYAFVRGVQLLVVAVVAWATLAVARTPGPHVEELVAAYLRWFVRVAVVLVALGAVFGPIFVPAAGKNLERFTWIGAHPNGAGLILATAIVATLAAPLRALRLAPLARGAVLVVLASAMYANHSRTSWLGLVCGALLAFGLAGRLRPIVHWVGAPLLGFVALGSIVLWGDQIWEYVLREQDSDSLASGHGRFGLWSTGIEALRTPFDWLCGLGYGTARTLFLSEGEWARSAHNSILSWLVSNGVIAVVVLLAILGVLVRNLVRVRIVSTQPSGLAVVGLVCVLGVNALAADTMAEPALGLVAVYLVAAVSIGLAEHGRTPPHTAAGEGAVPSSVIRRTRMSRAGER
jgi:O-antigen ligase